MRPITAFQQHVEPLTQDFSDEEEEEENRGPAWGTQRPRSVLPKLLPSQGEPELSQRPLNPASPYVQVPSQMHPVVLHSKTPPYSDVMEAVRRRYCGAALNSSLYSVLNGDPVLRYGRAGAPWRHVRRTTGYEGANIMFVDGNVKQEDTVIEPPWSWETLHSDPRSIDPRMQGHALSARQANQRRAPDHVGLWRQHSALYAQSRYMDRERRYTPRSRLLSSR